MATDYKKTGFRFIDDNIIEFYCGKDKYKDIADNEDVYVSGSFNSWLNSGDSSWKLGKKVSKNAVYYSLQKPVSVVLIPGNSGFPEFRFFGLSQLSHHFLTEKNPCEEYSFQGNKLILKDEAEVQEIAKIKSSCILEKKLSDFDLNCPACRAEISNIRLVPGTKCLFRGYNPFKRSRGEMDTENVRIELVQKAYGIYGIKSDITLNGYEGANVLDGEILPDVIKNIEKENNRLCINIDYNLVYFHTDAFDFYVALQKIGRFIIEHPSPFYIHCRLGSDRTGVVCAIFAALCGAAWNDIASDYEKTSNMGIGEYRNRRLLCYSLNKMLDKNPENCKDLAHEMQSFFLKENIFTMEEMQKIIEKLNTPLENTETDFFDFSGKHICKLGKKIN